MITIGIPAFNEEKNIAGLIIKLRKFTDNILVCDDGSSDATADIAKALGATVISHQKNLGYGAAIRSIFLKAKEMNSDVLVTFDADGQHRVEDIQTVISPILDKKFGIVIGSRFLSNEDTVPKYRKLGVNVITKITNTSISEKLTDSQSGFRAYSNQVLKEIIPSDSGMGVSTEILIKASSKNISIGEVPIKIIYGENTSTHNPVSHGTSVIFSTIKFTSIENPLKFYGIPSLIFLIIGASFTIWTIQDYTVSGDLITNIAIIAIGCVIVGVVLLLCAILLYSLVSVVREGTKN